MKTVSPYLHLDGTTKEAMNFYKECFGGELYMKTVGETKMDEEMKKGMPTSATPDKIMHSNLVKNGKTLLFASDMMDPTTFTKGDNYSVCLDCDSEDEARTLWKKLSTGGKVQWELSDAPWGGIFGSFTDTFGIDWMVNYTKQPM